MTAWSIWDGRQSSDTENVQQENRNGINVGMDLDTMKKLATLTILTLVILPLCAFDTLAAKRSTKDAGFGECVLWCAGNRTGDQYDKCVRNCECYYGHPNCKKKTNKNLENSVPPSSPQGPVLEQ